MADDGYSHRQKELARRVGRGVSRLNMEFAHKWVPLIDLDRLDMDESDLCILGQLYGDYFIGETAIFTYSDDSEEDAVKHGFILESNASPEDVEQLKAFWQIAVRAVANLPGD